MQQEVTEPPSPQQMGSICTSTSADESWLQSTCGLSLLSPTACAEQKVTHWPAPNPKP